MPIVFTSCSLKHYPFPLRYLRQSTTATRIFATQRLVLFGLDRDDILILLPTTLYSGHSGLGHGSSILLRLQVIAYDRFIDVAVGRRAGHGHARLGELDRTIGEKVRRIQAYIVAKSVVRRSAVCTFYCSWYPICSHVAADSMAHAMVLADVNGASRGDSLGVILQ